MLKCGSELQALGLGTSRIIQYATVKLDNLSHR